MSLFPENPSPPSTYAERAEITCGDWADEQASCYAFDSVMARHAAWWSVDQEVPGYIANYAPWQESSTAVRIDRVLIPTPRLCESGWPGWAVGVEIKRSGVPCGPALAQAMDYARSVFHVRGVPQYLRWVFVWPLKTQHGPLASLMVHNHVGTATTGRGDLLHLQSGESAVFGFDWQYQLKLGRNLMRLGVGAGSR